MRRVALLASLSAFVFLANLGGAHLWDEDEAIFSQTAREMFERGERVVPYFNGEVFVHKPPMMYWLMEASYELLGTHAFAARFPSALFGLASVLLTYRLGQLMFSPGVGFWAGVILATNLNFMLIARAATPDAFLVFFSTLALLAFVSGSAKARAASAEPNERNAPWVGQNCFEPSWLTYALSYAAMGLGVLVKGPIGVVLPTAVIGLFLLIVRSSPADADGDDLLRGRLRCAASWIQRVFSPRHVLSTIWSMRPLTAIAVVLAVAAPWYAWVGVRTDGEFLVGFFGVHNFGRFLNAMENHRGPVFYYLVAMAVGFFPWSVLWGPCWLDMTRQLRAGDPWRAGYIFLCAWLVVWVGFFSLAGTKLPSYVVPAYPALALAAGCLVDRWLRGSVVLARIWIHLIWGTVALAGLAIMIALPIVAHIYLGNDWWLGAIGLVPLAGAVLGWSLARRQQRRAALWTLTTVAATLGLALFGFAAQYVDGYRDTPPLGEIVRLSAQAGDSPVVGTFHCFHPSFVFYASQHVAELDNTAKVQQFFAMNRANAFLLTTQERLDTLASQLPSDVEIIDSRPTFLRSGRTVLLGRAARAGATAAKPSPPASSAFE